MSNKKEIRRQVGELKRAHSSADEAEKSRRIWEKVRESQLYKEADTVFIYIDMPHEVRTRPFIEQMWKDGKKVAVPKCDGPEMTFWYITYFGQLAPGLMNILEPITHCPGIVTNADAAEKALMVMPGVAFDKNKHRIGYGGGFYDRYLSLHKEHPTIACAFEFQIFDQVPHEDLDIDPQYIFTEENIF